MLWHRINEITEEGDIEYQTFSLKDETPSE